MLKWLWLSGIVIVIDQISKFYFEHAFTQYQQVPVIPGFFNLTLAYNKGAAFSILADQGGWQRWFFSILAIVVSIFIITWIRNLKSHERTTAVALALILGGAIGNMIDRLTNPNGVVDFLHFYYQQYHFPAFNVADSAITVGAALLIFHTLFGQHENNNPTDAEK